MIKEKKNFFDFRGENETPPHLVRKELLIQLYCMINSQYEQKITVKFESKFKMMIQRV